MDKDLNKIVAKAQNGDHDAFCVLYSKYSADLYRFAFYLLGNAEDAQDAVQDACIQAFTHIAALKKAAAFKSWFFKILSNCCKAKLIQAAKHGTPLALDDFSDLIPDECSAEFISSLELRDAISALPDDDRNIVLLSVIAGYKSYEISDMLGIRASTVRSKLSRSLAKLRAILSDSRQPVKLEN